MVKSFDRIAFHPFRGTIDPTGTMVLTWVDAHIEFRSLPTGELVRSVALADWSGWRCACSCEGKRLASWSETNVVHVWDGISGSWIRTIDVQAQVDRVELSDDGEKVYTFSRDGIVRVWSVQTGREVMSLPFGDWNHNSICALAVSSISNVIAASSGSYINLWHEPTGRRIDLEGSKDGKAIYGEWPHLFRGHNMIALALSPNGQVLASGGYDDRAFLWDTNSGRRIRPLSAVQVAGCSPYMPPFFTIAFSRDGTRVAGGGTVLGLGQCHGALCVWDTATGEAVNRQRFVLDEIDHVSSCHDGTWVLNCYEGGERGTAIYAPSQTHT